MFTVKAKLLLLLLSALVLAEDTNKKPRMLKDALKSKTTLNFDKDANNVFENLNMIPNGDNRMNDNDHLVKMKKDKPNKMFRKKPRNKSKKAFSKKKWDEINSDLHPHIQHTNELFRTTDDIKPHFHLDPEIRREYLPDEPTMPEWLSFMVSSKASRLTLNMIYYLYEYYLLAEQETLDPQNFDSEKEKIVYAANADLVKFEIWYSFLESLVTNFYNMSEEFIKFAQILQNFASGIVNNTITELEQELGPEVHELSTDFNVKTVTRLVARFWKNMSPGKNFKFNDDLIKNLDTAITTLMYLCDHTYDAELYADSENAEACSSKNIVKSLEGILSGTSLFDIMEDDSDKDTLNDEVWSENLPNDNLTGHFLTSDEIQEKVDKLKDILNNFPLPLRTENDSEELPPVFRERLNEIKGYSRVGKIHGMIYAKLRLALQMRMKPNRRVSSKEHVKEEFRPQTHEEELDLSISSQADKKQDSELDLGISSQSGKKQDSELDLGISLQAGKKQDSKLDLGISLQETKKQDLKLDLGISLQLNKKDSWSEEMDKEGLWPGKLRRFAGKPADLYMYDGPFTEDEMERDKRSIRRHECTKNKCSIEYRMMNNISIRALNKVMDNIKAEDILKSINFNDHVARILSHDGEL